MPQLAFCKAWKEGGAHPRLRSHQRYITLQRNRCLLAGQEAAFGPMAHRRANSTERKVERTGGDGGAGGGGGSMWCPCIVSLALPLPHRE